MPFPAPGEANAVTAPLVPTQIASAPGLCYAGFWLRLAASAIDYLLWLPLSFAIVYLNHKYRLFNLWYFLPGTLLGLWYQVYLVYRYGGTPGKLLLKIRITMCDGSPVNQRAAWLRYSVSLVLSVLASIAGIIAVLRMSDALYYSLDYWALGQQTATQSPFWTHSVLVLFQIWTWSEFVILLLNQKRRALQDFIAGTVVIKTNAVS